MKRVKTPASTKTPRPRKQVKANDVRTPEKGNTAEIVHDLIRQFAGQINKDTRISVADFLRLLSVLKELEDEKGIDEIRIKWVEKETAER
jgi:hypothetical protein